MKTHSDDKPFKCSMCELKFKAKQGLIDHENRHLGLKHFECSICKKRFITKSLCLSHLQTHSEDVPRDHQCTECAKFFSTKSCLKMHMKIHFNDRQHVCGVGNRKQKKICSSLDRIDFIQKYDFLFSFECAVLWKGFRS